MTFEHKSEPLLSRERFLIRMAKYMSVSGSLILLSLAIGILGYHYLNDLDWLDALLNASMILAGMGPVDTLKNESAKLFASFYAIFSGVVFLTTVAVMLSPIAHRVLHKLHLQD